MRRRHRYSRYQEKQKSRDHRHSLERNFRLNSKGIDKSSDQWFYVIECYIF